MPSHEERAREILDGLAAFGHIGFHAGTTDADHAVSVVSDALAEVELEAYERAAKIADAVHDENSDPYAKASAASVALRIRALGKESGS